MDIYIQLCEISAFCGVVLDGTYTKEDIIKVCKLCTDVLRSRRVGHLYSPGIVGEDGKEIVQ